MFKFDFPFVYIIEIFTKKINLKQIPKMLNLNSLNLLYGDLKSEKKNYFQKFSFHKKIFLEKQKIKKNILEKR